MNKIIGIYTITNTFNNKVYVGYSIEIKKRMSYHLNMLKHKKHPNTILQNSWNKYGENNFKFEILEECDKDYLVSQENYWCIMLNSHDCNYGFNIESTGNRANYKRKKQNKQKKYQWSDQTRERYIKSKTGLKQTEEHKKALSEASYMKGRFGKLHRGAKPVIKLDLLGNEIRKFDCAKDVEKILNICSKHISSVCKGQRNSSHGFKWKYDGE